jgi:Tfp pilus assembly protein PilV
MRISTMPVRHSIPTAGSRGFTFIELLVASFLLLLVFYGLAAVYAKGRRQVDYEEDRRKATAVAQARLDGLRRDYRFDNLLSVDGVDTTYVVDNRSFFVSHSITDTTPEPQAKTVEVTVTWMAQVAGAGVARSVVTETVFGRGMPTP